VISFTPRFYSDGGKVFRSAAEKIKEQKIILKSAWMRKSNREKRKAGIGNATEIAICDTLEERTPLSRQVQQISGVKIVYITIPVPVNLPVLHTLQCIKRIKALSCCVNLGGTTDFFRP